MTLSVRTAAYGLPPWRTARAAVQNSMIGGNAPGKVSWYSRQASAPPPAATSGNQSRRFGWLKDTL